jgi:hypothetical protein
VRDSRFPGHFPDGESFRPDFSDQGYPGIEQDLPKVSMMIGAFRWHRIFQPKMLTTATFISKLMLTTATSA